MVPTIAHASEERRKDNQTTDLCEEARQMEWFESEWVCIAEGRGLALALPDQAEQLALTLDGAVTDFERYFAPSNHNVAVLSTPALPAEATAFLKERGFLSLPWITETSRADLIRSSVERQVRAQTQGMSEEQRAGALAQALAQLGDLDAGAPHPPSALELGALAHEAGHILFKEFYDGDARPANSITRYGSSAADWIDELAAVLNENDDLTKGRYANARKRLEKGEPANPFALAEFFEMEHPSLRAAQALRERSGKAGDNVTLVLSGEEAEQFLKESRGDPSEFYLQARLFADFMLDTTKDQRVFAKIANGVKADGSFEAWLSANHEELGLAADIVGLEAQFGAWVVQAFAGEPDS
ncbi:hypothetical protein EH31_07460 [Erythrobacter longus]|uniref:Uncharacterized protein n=2 Tax=Erythrobacter longus TaxID=1044 RepID=A0A074M7X0_ERYLO|nr:hypothetical protein EH31_07460 [Erythrobacter longus]